MQDAASRVAADPTAAAGLGARARRSAGVVGIIANPVSARDIRRIVANASSPQLTDRVNIVLRAMAALGGCGIQRVCMMPDREGLRALLERHLKRERAAGGAQPWPR